MNYATFNELWFTYHCWAVNVTPTWVVLPTSLLTSQARDTHQDKASAHNIFLHEKNVRIEKIKLLASACFNVLSDLFVPRTPITKHTGRL